MNEDQLTTLLFDLLTAIVVFGVPWRLWRWWHGKRQTWKYPLAALAVLGWLVVIYGSFVAPRMLVVRTVAVDLRDGGGAWIPGSSPRMTGERTMTVALLSDTHFGVFKGKAWAERLATRLETLAPDAIVFGGDLVSNDAGLEALTPFKRLAPPLGKFSVLGNWDYHIGAVDVRKRLGSQGVKMLVNRAVPLSTAPDAASLYLVGLDEMFYGTPDWTKALAAVPAGAPWIVAVHEPEGALWASHFGARLVLSGHTHGGQVRLPLVGAVATPRSVLGRAFDKGLFKFFNTQLFITSGTGETGPRARLFNPPEIVMLRVTY